MPQKVIRVGNSLGITIPPEFAQAYGLNHGSIVEIRPVENGLLLQPATINTDLDPKHKANVNDLIRRYRPVLDALAADRRL